MRRNFRFTALHTAVLGMVHAFLGTRKRTQGEEVVISLPGGDYSGRATRVAHFEQPVFARR